MQIANGQTKLLESGDESTKFVVVSRHISGDLTGVATVTLVPVFNNAIGSSNVSGAEQQAGEIKLRCIAFKNMHTGNNVSSLKVWLGILGTQRTSNIGQLPASGAGAIQTSGSFADWPDTGFCRITTAGDSLREIVHYSTRTDTVLTVPAAGRGLLETSPAAGAADDKLDAVPGMKLAKEAPGPSTGAFSIAANENDTSAVSGLSWTTGITEDTGLDLGDLEPDEMMAVWLWLVVVADQAAGPRLDNKLCWKFTANSVVFEPNGAAGSYRIADEGLERYELYRGVDAEPDLAGGAWETFTSLPHTSGDIRLGSELVTNGAFDTDSDWIKGVGWAISGGRALWQEDVGWIFLKQVISITSGRTYRVSFTLQAIEDGGKVTVQVGGTSGTQRTANDTYIEDLVAGEAEEIRFIPEGTGSSYLEIDDVSVKEKSGAATYYFVLRKRNKWGLLSQNIESWSVKLDADGNEAEPSPEAPSNINIEAAADAKGLVGAEYFYDRDDEYAATHWLIYFTDDGSDPDPEADEPTVIVMHKTGHLAYLQWTSPAADDGNALKVLVRTRRVDGEDVYDSDNTDIYSVTASSQGPEGTLSARALLGRSAESM